MSFKMVVLDLDGTVINSSGRISPRTRAAVRAARAAGLLVVVATGRRLRAALPYLHDLSVEGPTILCNGALAVDLSTWHTLIFNPLGAAGTAAVARWLRSGLAPLVCRHTLQGPDLLYQTPVAVATDWLAEHERAGHLGYTEDLRTAAAGALKLILPAREHTLRAVAAAGGLPGQMMTTIAPDGTGILELWREDVSKASALELIAGRTGIQRQEIVAFGDNINDVELLAYAGLGIAMGNAVPAARAAAREVCGTCDEDGVAATLEALIRPLRAVV